jgi:PAS domain S-box-containing protein
MFGYTLEDIPTGKSWVEKAYPDPMYRQMVLNSWKEDFSDAKLGKDIPRTFTVTCKNGSTKEILFKRVALTNGSNLVTHEDITENKRTVEALKESENKFRNLVENSIVGVYLIQDGAFKYVNSRFAELHGYKIEEMVDKIGVKETTLPEDLPIVNENIRKRVEGKEGSIHYEFRIVTKNKEIKNVQILGCSTKYHGRPAVIGTLLDVSERKQVEEALRESESRFQIIVEHSADTFLLHDFDGRIIDVNQHACKSLGYTREELLALSIKDIDQDFIRDKHEEKWKQIVPGTPIILEGVHKRKDGTTFPVEVHLGVFESGNRKLM